jgi:hypothetical protein
LYLWKREWQISLHILSNSRIHLIAIIDHEKMPREKKTCGEGLKILNSRSIEFLIPPMQHIFLGVRCLGL